MLASIRERDGVTIIDLEGDLVVGDGDEVLHDLVGKVIEEHRRHILVNLAKVGRMDSSGIGELVSAWKSARRAGLSLRLLRPGDRVRYTLHLSQVLPLLEVYEDEAAALASFAATPG